MARKMIDCRQVPSEIGCTLTMRRPRGTRSSTPRQRTPSPSTATQDTPELREMLRGALQDAEPALA